MEPSHLHSDIMFEILSRTSTDTLGRCRLASNEWNHMTYEPKFKKFRSQNTNTVDGFFVQEISRYRNLTSLASISAETRKISLNFVPGCGVRVIAVAENSGIILCTSDNPRRYGVPRFYVCKPQSKQCQQIPNPRTRFFALGMAMAVISTNPFCYKILRISSPKSFVRNRQQLLLEIFDSKAWKWKILKDVLLPADVWFFRDTAVIEASGAFHCLLHQNLIFSIDIKKEEWKIANLPVNEQDCRRTDMAKYAGKLALMCMDMDGYMHTWVLESYINMVWSKRFVLDMKEPGSTFTTHIMLGFYGSDIIVVCDNIRSSLKYYDFKNEKFLAESSELKIHYTTPKIFPFCLDFEPCCLGQGRDTP